MESERGPRALILVERELSEKVEIVTLGAVEARVWLDSLFGEWVVGGSFCVGCYGRFIVSGCGERREWEALGLVGRFN